MPEVEMSIEEVGSAVATSLLKQSGEGSVSDLVRSQVAAQMTEKLAALDVESQLSELRSAIAERPPAAPAPRTTPPLLITNPHGHNPLAIGAALDGKYDSFADFVKATLSLAGKRVADPRLRLISESGDIKAALDGENVELGGALVPEEFRAQLMMMALQDTSIRSMATVLPMGSSTLTIPSIRDTTHAGGSVYGGVRSYWTESGAAINESDPEFKQTRLTAKGLLTLTTINNTLISDSFTSLPALLGRLFMGSTMWTEEAAFIRGTGAGEPLGIIDAPATAEVTRKSGGNDIEADDIGAMEARLLPECDPYAVWMIHPSVREDLYTLTNGSIQVWHQDMASRIPMTLNGRRLIVNEHMSALGTSGDIMLVDWRFYLIGDRQAMSLAASEHVKFSSNQTQIRGVQRLDGQPWIDAPLTPAQGTDTLSPFVKLS